MNYSELSNTALVLSTGDENQRHRFLRTVPIESDDHRLIAITKLTTSWDGSLRYPLLNTVCVAKSSSNDISRDDRFYRFEDKG